MTFGNDLQTKRADLINITGIFYIKKINEKVSFVHQLI